MSEEVRYATGSEILNKTLGVIGGLKAGDFSGAETPIIASTDGLVLAVGIDTLTQHKTLLQYRALCFGYNSSESHTRHVFVVYSEVAGIDKGLYFNTRTVAEVHFDNITGVNKERCTEASGGRTLQEMIQFLFHS